MEYFNTVVVQPHRKLVTNQGRGYHVRCRYQSQERTLTNDFNVKFPWSGGAQDRDGASGLGTTPLTATAAMPSSSMRIFYGEASEGLVAENVKIGDPLSLVISIDEQDIFGMHVTQCLVRDGLGWSEQGLINEEGCPQDYEIMGELEYSSSKTTALVKFQAHKFPYTSSVYYQCNVKLCIKHAGGCDQVPPVCEDGVNIVRKKRQVVELDERNNDAEGKRLTPCLAFRNEGRYRVSAVSVVSQPPLAPQRTAMAYDEASWSSLNWDADQELEDL